MELKQGMKAKTIKSVLRRKIDAWLNSIEDEDLRRRCRGVHNSHLTTLKMMHIHIQ